MSALLWLASGSPRRRELLTLCGYALEVHPADVDESLDPSLDPIAWAAGLAARKASVAPADRVVLAADTVVHRGARIFDKPADRAHAVATLRALAGSWHDVTTAVHARHHERVHAFAVTTTVRFRALSDHEIARYVATGEADDKAGAYGIQGAGAALVAEVRGSWTNVMGLPVEETLAALAALGLPPTSTQ